MLGAVVLAGGAGRGCWPYCGIRQKVTLPVLNTPIVRRLVENLQAAGAEEIAAVTGHRAAAVRACLGDLEGVRFVACGPGAGPVEAALAGLETLGADAALVAYGDVVTTPGSVQALARAYEDDGAPALLVCDPREDAPHWMGVEVEGGEVTGVWGHGGGLHFGGMAVADAGTLRRYLLRNPGIVDKVRIGAMPAVEGDIAHSFALMREDGMAVRAVRAEGFLIDVDRPWHLLEANRLAGQHHFAELEGRRIAGGADVSDAAHIAEGAKLDLAPGARIGAGCHIRGALRLGPGSVVENGAIVGGGCYVGASTTIKDYCSVSGGSVLGDRALVQHCAEFGGVLMDTVYLYHYCCVTGLIGLNVDIGAATVCGTWRFDDGTRGQPVKGRTEYPAHWGDGAFIGDYVRTGVNAMFMPGVKVGWHSCVGPGVIVREDVPERTLLLAKQEQIQRPWGPEQYGW